MQKYKLVYEVNKIIVETILPRESRSICTWKKKELLKTGVYNNGRIRILKVK